MSAQLVEALRLLLAKVRRDAPELSGKLLGECEAALAAAEAQPVKEPPSDRQMLLDALESIERTALCTHWLGMNESRRRFAIARDARIAIERANGLRPSAPQPAPTVAQPAPAPADVTARLIEIAKALPKPKTLGVIPGTGFCERDEEIKGYTQQQVLAILAEHWAAAPPQPVPLTDEQIAALVLATVYDGDGSTPHRDAWATEIGIPFARAIERAHGIGGKA